MDNIMPVHGIVQEWAKRDPARPAIEYRGQVVTYGELDEWAESFATAVAAAGGRPGTLVAVLASRSPVTVACFLGILKAGAACVPIFSGYPEERIRFILSDAIKDLVCVFYDEDSAGSNIAHQKTFCMHEVPRTSAVAYCTPEIGADTLSYVLYTSGSTGMPKGVMITHGSLQAVVRELIAAYDIRPIDRVLHCAPLGFDTSISEITRALCGGSCLVIAPPEVTSSPSFFYRLGFLEKERITRAVLPAALLRSAKEVALDELGVLVTTGEACTQEVVDKWAPDRTLLNAWGSTESTFSGTIARLRPGHKGRPPVGRPIRIAEVFVADETGQLVTPGEIGQIYIGGLGVSAGYYRRPELTAQRFVPNRWGSRSAKVFATGDLGRWLPNGLLDCLGRMDQQVKISGYRVDMTEVESALRACTAIRVDEAVVVARDSPLGGKELVAHVVLMPGSADSGTRASSAITGALLRYLRGTLPSYAVPQHIRLWGALPLNAHGKVDRYRLSTEAAQ